MKKLNEILNYTAESIVEDQPKYVYEEMSAETPATAPATTVSDEDRAARLLDLLDQCAEMIDDMYNTISDLSSVDSETELIIGSIYNVLDDGYSKIDSKYDIAPVDFDGYELDESYNILEDAVLVEEMKTPDKLYRLGFRPAPVTRDTWMPSKGKVHALYGIPMRAGKWADIFFGVTDDQTKGYSIITADGVESYAKMDDAIRAITKMANEETDMKSLSEVLDKDAPASEWIDDFIKSDAPQFKGKTKKERIKMALGAYYAAQRNEETAIQESCDFTQFSDKKLILWLQDNWNSKAMSAERYKEINRATIEAKKRNLKFTLEDMVNYNINIPIWDEILKANM